MARALQLAAIVRSILAGAAILVCLTWAAPAAGWSCRFDRGGLVAHIRRAIAEDEAATFWWPGTRLRCQDPVLRFTRKPSSDRPLEPAYDLAVFRDGLVVYEGHRCVAVGGLLVKRLRWSERRDLGELLDANAAPWEILRALGADKWVGEPEDRLACEAGDTNLVPVDRGSEPCN